MKPPLLALRPLLCLLAWQLGATSTPALAQPGGVEQAAYAAEAPTAAGRGRRDLPAAPSQSPQVSPSTQAKSLTLPPRGKPTATDGAESSAKPMRRTSFFSTGLASLAVVLGLFFVAAWAVRRGLPPGPAKLPSDVVEMLGRTPLAGRQFAHLIRCGNKLLLVYLAPGVAETLTEITDPAEVDRLAGLCRQAHPQSATASFRHVFQQFSREKPADAEATT